jgi:hypothetical protein
MVHLRRDFQKLVDHGGAAARLGRALQRIADWVFEEWHLFRGGTFGRRALQNHLHDEAEEFERLLQAGAVRMRRRRRSAPTCWGCCRRCGGTG